MIQKFNDIHNTITLFFIFFMMMLLLVACGGNGDAGGGGAPDTTAPTVSKTNPSSGSFAASGDQIIITFDETMDTTSLVLSGDMASESNGGIFSTSTKPVSGSSLRLKATNDTLTITPQTGWSYGNERTLTVDGEDLAGNALPTLELSFNIVEGIVYVSTTGDDANDGTKENPKRIISAGISEGADKGYTPGAVLVSHGIYSVDSGSTPPTHVVLVEGISIYGGYTADFIQRDFEENLTTMVDTSSTTTGDFLNPNRVVEAGNGITKATIIDGFEIFGGGGDLSSGIFIHSGGSPKVSHNTIRGGNGTSLSMGSLTMGISSSPTFQNNAIDGGNSESNSYGIYNVSSSPTIQNNTIHGGISENLAFGILSTDSSSPTIKNNTINGGNAGSTSYGIYSLTSSSSIIQNNTIDGGSGGNNSYGIYTNTSLTSKIQNNTIYGGSGGSISYGILTHNSSPIIQNNTIDGGSGNKSYSIYNVFSFPNIKNNAIDGGIGGSSSYGIYNASSAATIQNNTINGGNAGSTSYGVYSTTSSSSIIQNNIIDGGSSRDNSYGILIDSSSPIIQNNTIDGGSSGSNSSGIFFPFGPNSPSVTIQNNNIFTSEGSSSRYCILDENPISTPSFPQNNNLFDCPTALFRKGSFYLTTIEQIHQFLGQPAGGNVSLNPGFLDVSGGDFHLASWSPLEIRQGGLDLSTSPNPFSTDKDGNTRTAPWSIGAYEQD